MSSRKGKCHFSTEEKAVLVRMAASGSTVFQVARLLKLPRSTVHSILERRQARGTIETAKRFGHPRKTIDQDLREIGQCIESNQKMKLSEISNLIPADVSTRTLQKQIRACKLP
ncbi:hypothetical protein VP01_7124g2 [Puccinia sorghi]|uniref:Transposase IS30-like HTH domain-containing protein n=1 Tax=Puccinia sorghi TaxID=27349 RepID=A0A0L6UDG4_9BASI|nr:hypothetical protein VP01_7124g2 [Puccinia sorghi]